MRVVTLMKQLVPIAKCASLFLVILLAVSWTPAQTKSDPIAEVTAALDAQVNGWNAGVPDKAMSVYYDSPDMLWVNRSGIRKGYDLIRASYQRTPAERSRMGTYSYETLHTDRLGRDCVFFVIRWKIESNGRTTMGGVTSMVWKRINKRWVITAEHAS
jgi:hypothetical protein